MGTLLARQSSAEIVDGQVIEASDFNDEFDHAVTVNATQFAGTMGRGHAHTGTGGEGPLLNIAGTVGATAITGILGYQHGGFNYTSTAPTASYDVDDGYVKGSTIINTNTNDVFQCVDNSQNASIWVKRQGTSSASIPAVTNDVDEGYVIGSVWLYTGVTPNLIYICVDNSDGAAVWVPQSRGRTHYTTSQPTATDDIDLGFEVGSIWVNTSTDVAYICADSTDGAAVWLPIGSARVNSTTSNPTVNDDVDLGYQPGSIWVNTTDDTAFICVDNTDGAAVWNSVGYYTFAGVKTGTYDMNTDEWIIADATAGTALINAPSTSTVGAKFKITKVGSNIVTVGRNGSWFNNSGTVDGQIDALDEGHMEAVYMSGTFGWATGFAAQ